MKYRGQQSGGVRTAESAPSPHQRALARGLELHQAGRLADAEAVYRQVLAADPGNAPGLHLLGALANQVGQHAAAVELISQAIQIEPTSAAFHSNLGVAYQSLGRLEDAAGSYERALAFQSDHVDALNNLGVALQALGRLDGALASFERSLKLRPNHSETLNNVGTLYLALGRLDEAEARLRRALKLRPGYADALTSLGGVLIQHGRADEALAACEQAVKAAPADARAHDMLGTILRAIGRHGDAIASYQRALTLNPDGAHICMNLAGTLQLASRTADAAAAYRQALALNPDSSIAHSGLIFALDLLPDQAAEARNERQRWNERFGQAWRDRPADYPNRPDPDRPLRVGYVSADFCHHSASMAFMPILRQHDHTQVQVYCYSGTASADAITQEARSLADVWRDVAYHSDDALEAQIRADQIDVLVDLSGHSAGNRLPVFARKPAPVQVTAWGYAAGTGLEAIQYFLADPVAVPADEHERFAEQVVNLPSVLTYEAPAYTPPVMPGPAPRRGFVTFGAFNRLDKISSSTREVWARTLLAVPDSRLIVKTLRDPADPACQQLVEDLATRGVARDRIELRGRTTHQEHLAAHADVDVMLDSFPQGGGITALESLLMGVPVVTLLGEQIVGRIAASFLTSLGMDDLVAETPDEYVSIAAQLAGDLPRLERERSTLRDRVTASPLANPQLYTRAVEEIYRMLWRRQCEGRAE